MDAGKLQDDILKALYEQYFGCQDAGDLGTVHAKSGLEFNDFARVLMSLLDRGLIRDDGLANRYGYTITARGLIEVENRGLADHELIRNNRQVRTQVIECLAGRYERLVCDSDLHFSEIAIEISSDEQRVCKSVEMLDESGIVQETALGCYLITQHGLDLYSDYNRRKANADEFERIKGLSPNARGRALDTLITTILQGEEWSSEGNVRT
jgi:predicted transcriptional regulator